ncbi:MAG TPA: hypothetical protein VNG13_03605 [Mycobacteriales bacterium]|nr:hypothetical protein [Mycobacteriales bacterium]
MLRRRLLVLLTALAALGPAVVSLAPAAHASGCAGSSGKRLSGILAGQDGRDINAQVGFDIVDRYNHKIGLNGCATSAYGIDLWFNKGISGQGVPNPPGKSQSWITPPLPSNAAAVWIEVWTRTNQPKNCATCDGPIDTSRYGFVNRRAIKPGTSNIRLLAPLKCGVSGGTAGTVQGKLYDFSGHPTSSGWTIYAWSQLTPDGSKPLQGWGVAQMYGDAYMISTLASGQPYVLWATYHGVTQKHTFTVKSCQNVPGSMRA